MKPWGAHANHSAEFRMNSETRKVKIFIELKNVVLMNWNKKFQDAVGGSIELQRLN